MLLRKEKKQEQELLKTKGETIVIIGAPGSGKDTQAEFLVDALGYQIVSTGQLARILAGHNEKVHELLKKGEFLPDTVIEDELISAFVLLPDEQPVIIDGYPRTLEQAKKLGKILEENGRKIDKVIYISVTEAEAIKRIGKRRECLSCGHFTSVEKGEKCPECGGRLTTREDDKPEAVKKRFKLFHEKTEPIINFFQGAGILVEVDGNPDPATVKEGIKNSL